MAPTSLYIESVRFVKQNSPNLDTEYVEDCQGNLYR